MREESNTKKRAVCLNCIDGRVQLPVVEWIRNNYPVDYVDMITEPGMDSLLADSDSCIEGINNKLNISIDSNNASIIFVVGHHDCKGNLVSDAAHKGHIDLAVERVRKEFPAIEIIGLWVNDQWQTEEL